jgi:hypothetical protein
MSFIFVHFIWFLIKIFSKKASFFVFKEIIVTVWIVFLCGQFLLHLFKGFLSTLSDIFTVWWFENFCRIMALYLFLFFLHMWFLEKFFSDWNFWVYISYEISTKLLLNIRDIIVGYFCDSLTTCIVRKSSFVMIPVTF